MTLGKEEEKREKRSKRQYRTHANDAGNRYTGMRILDIARNAKKQFWKNRRKCIGKQREKEANKKRNSKGCKGIRAGSAAI